LGGGRGHISHEGGAIMAMKRLSSWMALAGILLAFFTGCASPQSKFCIECQKFVPPNHEHFIKKQEKTESPEAFLLPARILADDTPTARMNG